MNFTAIEIADRIAKAEGLDENAKKTVLNRLRTLLQRMPIPVKPRGGVGFLSPEAATVAYLLLSLQEAQIVGDTLRFITTQILNDPHFPREVSKATAAHAMVQAGEDVVFWFHCHNGGQRDCGLKTLSGEIEGDIETADAVAEIMAGYRAVTGKVKKPLGPIKVSLQVSFSDLTKRLLVK